MAKRPIRKLKVFEARLGFYDTIVAAPSQAAALRAWGTSQNLFANGDATTAIDEAAISAAIAQPEIVLRRAIGSNAPFALQPTSLPTLPDAPSKTAATKTDRERRPAAPTKPADRSKLDAAKAELRTLDEHRKREEIDFRREQEELETRREAAQQKYLAERKSATADVVQERSSYRKAGGTN